MSYLEEQIDNDRLTEKHEEYENRRRERNIYELKNGLDRLSVCTWIPKDSEYEHIDYNPLDRIADAIISSRKVVIPTTVGLTQQMTVGSILIIAVCHRPHKAIVTATGILGGCRYTLVAEVDSRNE